MATREDAENKVRDLKNLVAVYAEEHDLPADAVSSLQEKLDDLAVTIGAIE
jgi:hypothetical protein